MLQHLSLTPFHLRAGEESGPAGQEWLLIRIDAGFAYWMGPLRASEIAAGSMLVLPPASAGTIRASQLGDVVGWMFGLRPDALAGVLTFHELRAVEHVAGGLDNGIRILPASDVAAEHFKTLSVEGRGGISRRIQLLSIVAEVFDGMVMVLPEEETPSVPTAADRFHQLMQELPESELLSLAPEELAARCRCGVRHLNRLFRVQFGVSMRTKMTELRLRKARDLLGEADARVDNVARVAGYAHAGFFRAAFKRHMGVTPTEWLRTVRRKQERTARV